MNDLLKLYMLGVNVAYCFVIEFQKRGLPHAHILLIMREEDRIHTIKDIDSVIQAFVPDKGADKKLYELVLQYIVYNRCTSNPNNIYYSKEKNCCSKSFPKDFRD